MIYIKKFESFDIDKIIDEINKYNIINIDPYDEEDWEEIEYNDIIFYMDNFGNINFEKYDGTQDMVFKYYKLSRNNILKNLLKNRNRKINKNKIQTEKIHRLINNVKKTFDEKLDEIYKNGKVENSDKNINLNNIKNKEINEFKLYHFIDDGIKNVGVDLYIASIPIKENKDIFPDDLWDEIEKYKDELSINIKQITRNFKDKMGGGKGLGFNLYYPQLEYLVNNGEILLESTDIKEQIKHKLEKNIKYKINELLKELKIIKNNLSNVDGSIKYKLNLIEKRFPFIK